MTQRICSPAELDCVQGVTVGEGECRQFCEGILLGLERPYSVMDEYELAKFFTDYERYKNPQRFNLTFPRSMEGKVRLLIISELLTLCRTEIHQPTQVCADLCLYLHLRYDQEGQFSFLKQLSRVLAWQCINYII